RPWTPSSHPAGAAIAGPRGFDCHGRSCPSLGSRHHSDPRQGQRILPVRMDRRSQSLHSRHRLGSQNRTRDRPRGHLHMVSLRGLDLAEPPQAQLSDRTVVRNLLPVDRLLLGYVVVVSAVALARLSANPQCAWLLVANALIVTLVLLVTRADLGA